MELYETLAKRYPEKTDEEIKCCIETYTKIINGIDIEKNIDELLRLDMLAEVYNARKIDDYHEIFTLDFDIIEKIYNYLSLHYVGFMLLLDAKNFSNVEYPHCAKTIFNNSINVAFNVFKFLDKYSDTKPIRLSMALAFYYMNSNNEKSAYYFDYVINNSSVHSYHLGVLFNYAYFCDSYLAKIYDEYKFVINKLLNAISHVESQMKDKKNSLCYECNYMYVRLKALLRAYFIEGSNDDNEAIIKELEDSILEKAVLMLPDQNEYLNAKLEPIHQYPEETWYDLVDTLTYYVQDIYRRRLRKCLEDKDFDLFKEIDNEMWGNFGESICQCVQKEFDELFANALINDKEELAMLRNLDVNSNIKLKEAFDSVERFEGIEEITLIKDDKAETVFYIEEIIKEEDYAILNLTPKFEALSDMYYQVTFKVNYNDMSIKFVSYPKFDLDIDDYEI